VEVELANGDVVIAYTDGVVEERRDEEFFGEDRLRTVLQGCPGLPAAGVADCIVRAVEDFGQEAPADDIAVLALRAVPIVAAE
jgi:serine phosphatase RsbU (regulator of sigma subunit)